MSHYDALAFVAKVRGRWRTTAALRYGSVALAGAAVVLLAFGASVRLLHLSGDVLLAPAAAAVLAAAAWVAWALGPVRERPDDLRVARFIEERRPEFEDGLVTAVQMRGDDRPFARAMIRRADAAVGTLGPDDIIPSADVRRPALRAAASCILLLVAGAVAIAPLSRAWDAARLRLFPASVALEVSPGDARIVAGAPLRIRARVSGLPRSYDGRPVVTIVRSGRRERQDMTGRDGEFVLPLRSVSSGFRYVVDMAGLHSREYRVSVMQRPRILGIDVGYAYPRYTGLEPRTERDAGDVYAPAGTRVTIHVRTDKRVRRGELRFDQNSLALSSTVPAEASFVVARDMSYRVSVTDEDGLPNEAPTEYFIRVTDDRPPEVRILRPEGDRQVTPLEEVRVEARADDDYKLDRLELVYAVGAGPEHAIGIGPRGESSISGGHMLPLEDLRVKPGDVVRYYARAREQAHRTDGRREARSDMFFLEVTTFDGRFALAQSQAGGGGAADGDLQALIASQKNVITATWNLLRRAQKLRGGASTSDVRALAQAQGELRVRTLAMSGSAGPASLSDRSRRRDQGGALATAAAAMGQAADQLGRARLKDALPHEMDALTALMRAQSEDNRREVQQRASGSSLGNGRSGQDVSGLFDRELLRQQQTSYENQSSSETRRKTPDSDAERRLRELAARQDELARAQRQLAASQLDAEQRRRELERLTREQEQLRQEAEQLARDLSRDRGNDGRSRAVRDAAQEMQNAGGDLRRNDVESATRRGSRAAERLRGAEQRGAAGASAGDLQAEAQQLANEQREVDRKREQAPAGTAAAGAGRTQLADEQRRLADRADALEQNARSLSRGGNGKQQSAAAAAARDLEQGRVAERMRQEAERLQRGGSEQKSADAAGKGSQPLATSGSASGGGSSSIASTLDRVADRLGAAGDPRARKLNDEMSKGRAARERLNELGRQIERATRDGDEAARDALSRALQDARRMLRDGGFAPERQEWSDSAPGLESFKQDFSRWEDLKRNAELAIERRELAIGRELAGIKAREALAAGSIGTLPEQYRARVARYFETLARAGRRP